MVVHSVSCRVSIAMHVHKKLCDIVLRMCMLSFTVAAIIIATVAHMYLGIFSTTTALRFMPAS